MGSCSESPSRISGRVNESALGSVSSDFIQVLGGCTVLVLSGKKIHRFYQFFSSLYLTFKLELIFLMLGKQTKQIKDYALVSAHKYQWDLS